MITCTKSYRDFPAAHRQPGHQGHCRLIHGHNWGFDIEFGCDDLDSNGFVVDVGRLLPVKEMLTHYFDHTLLLNNDDPMLQDPKFKDLLEVFSAVRLVPNCGMEKLAEFVAQKVEEVLNKDFAAAVDTRGLCVLSVRCWEDSKNSSIYTNPDNYPLA